MREVKKPFEGVVSNLQRRYLETESEWAREEIGRYMSATPCKAITAAPLGWRGVNSQARSTALSAAVTLTFSHDAPVCLVSEPAAGAKAAESPSMRASICACVKPAASARLTH